MMVVDGVWQVKWLMEYVASKIADGVCGGDGGRWSVWQLRPVGEWGCT